MKITSLTRNDANQIIAEVLTCGRTIRVSAWNLDGLVETIDKTCTFTNKDEIRQDLNLNYKDFK